MKIRKTYTYLVVVIIVIAGYFFYTFYQKKQISNFEQETQISDMEDNIPSQCENGEWTEFSDYEKSGNFPEYADNANLKSGSGDGFTNEDGSILFMTGENYSLEFFVERDVRVEGINIGTSGKSKIYVKRIKCVGKEADKDIQAQRRNLMNYISKNIDELAIEKSKGGDWQILTFYFVNDSDIYIEYESSDSIGLESPYEARLWLVRVSKMGTDVPVIETLAYIQEDEEDPDKNVVKIGEDIYRDADNMSIYEFDMEANDWVLQ
jgi:hypothetical protein